MNFNEKKFQVKKFSYFSDSDFYDLRFSHEIGWSRIYEYPFVLSEISSLNQSEPSIHNCSWGFQDIHVVFKTWLDVLYRGVFHSDLKPSTLHNTTIWDLRNFPSQGLVDRFDVVINVSTLEEVKGDHVMILKHHLIQLRRGGRLIITFDLPGLQLAAIEDFLNTRIVRPQSKLTPYNSKIVDTKLGLPRDFGCGFLVVDRIV